MYIRCSSWTERPAPREDGRVRHRSNCSESVLSSSRQPSPPHTVVRPFPASAGYMEIFSVLYRDLDSYEAVSEEIAVLDPFVRGGDVRRASAEAVEEVRVDPILACTEIRELQAT